MTTVTDISHVNNNENRIKSSSENGYDQRVDQSDVYQTTIRCKNSMESGYVQGFEQSDTDQTIKIISDKEMKIKNK